MSQRSEVSHVEGRPLQLTHYCLSSSKEIDISDRRLPLLLNFQTTQQPLSKDVKPQVPLLLPSTTTELKYLYINAEVVNFFCRRSRKILVKKFLRQFSNLKNIFQSLCIFRESALSHKKILKDIYIVYAGLTVFFLVHFFSDTSYV